MTEARFEIAQLDHGRRLSLIPGVRRCHIDDPFGNRIELIEL